MHPATAPEEQALNLPFDRDRVLLEQLPQVRYIAWRIHERLPRHVALEDLVHAGVIGLMDALGKYDSGKHVRFGSYAKFRIRGAILDSLREMDWSPRELRRKSRRLNDAHSKLRLAWGRDPTEAELAAQLNINLTELQTLVAAIDGLEVISLQGQSRQDGEDEDLSAHLTNIADEGPLILCLRAEMKQVLGPAIEDLPEKERQVMTLYYYRELTMKEVGTKLGIGESRVSQIHSVAVVRLRALVMERTHSDSSCARGAAAGAL
jgi:RNA polymerase sigma factor for flagellar operon FliA